MAQACLHVHPFFAGLIEQSAGHPDLDMEAADVVKKWLFEPARMGKQPIAVWVLQPVKFELH